MVVKFLMFFNFRFGLPFGRDTKLILDLHSDLISNDAISNGVRSVSLISYDIGAQYHDCRVSILETKPTTFAVGHFKVFDYRESCLEILSVNELATHFFCTTTILL